MILVKTLINGTAAPGPHELTWDASDDGGRRVRAGVYSYRMDAGAWRSQRKVVFLEG
jgi:flagellar hook assembly protein FlgD